MSARVDFPLKLPVRLVLILILCTCLVTIHVVTEGLFPHFGHSEMNTDNEHENSDLEEDDDNLISLIRGVLLDDGMTTTPSDLAFTSVFSFFISPQLPPPNH